MPGESYSSLENQRDHQTVVNWQLALRHYASPDDGRSLFELIITAVPFFLLWLIIGCGVGIEFRPVAVP